MKRTLSALLLMLCLMPARQALAGEWPLFRLITGRRPRAEAAPIEAEAAPAQVVASTTDQPLTPVPAAEPTAMPASAAADLPAQIPVPAPAEAARATAPQQPAGASVAAKIRQVVASEPVVVETPPAAEPVATATPPVAEPAIVPVAGPAPAAATPAASPAAAPAAPAAEAMPAPLPGGPAPGTIQGPGTRARKVNCRHLVFSYHLQKAGPSGIMGIEAWVTRDGQTWQKSPAGIQAQGPYRMDVDEDGLYGFMLIARTGLGGGKSPPKPGDPVQFWVEVDTVKPVVVITGAQQAAGGGTVVVTWRATDKNLAARPITLSYVDAATGQAVAIVTRIENIGTYTWQVPAKAPQTVRIRVEAADEAGNVGMEETNPIQLDLSQPEVTDIEVNTNG